MFDLLRRLLAVILLTAVGLIVSLILFIRRRVLKIKRLALPTVLCHGFFAAVYLAYALMLWRYYPGITSLGYVFTVLSDLVMLIMMIKGCFLTRSKKAVIFCAVMTAAGIPLTWLAAQCVVFNVAWMIAEIVLFTLAFILEVIFCFDIFCAAKHVSQTKNIPLE